eukprot:2495811-Amphidinium_carterae.1
MLFLVWREASCERPNGPTLPPYVEIVSELVELWVGGMQESAYGRTDACNLRRPKTTRDCHHVASVSLWEG